MHWTPNCSCWADQHVVWQLYLHWYEWRGIVFMCCCHYIKMCKHVCSDTVIDEKHSNKKMTWNELNLDRKHTVSSSLLVVSLSDAPFSSVSTFLDFWISFPNNCLMWLTMWVGQLRSVCTWNVLRVCFDALWQHSERCGLFSFNYKFRTRQYMALVSKKRFLTLGNGKKLFFTVMGAY